MDKDDFLQPEFIKRLPEEKRIFFLIQRQPWHIQSQLIGNPFIAKSNQGIRTQEYLKEVIARRGREPDYWFWNYYHGLCLWWKESENSVAGGERA